MIPTNADERKRKADVQSGDMQGISSTADADSESIAELLAEGQAFEAEAVSGVENDPAPEKPIRTKQVLEDDVPREYDGN